MIKNHFPHLATIFLLLVTHAYTKLDKTDTEQNKSKGRLHRNLRNNVVWCKTFSKEFLNIVMKKSDILKGEKFHIWISEKGYLILKKPQDGTSSFQIAPFKDLVSATKISFDQNIESKVFWHKNDPRKFTIIYLQNLNRPFEVKGILKRLLDKYSEKDKILNMDSLIIGMTCQLKKWTAIKTFEMEDTNEEVNKSKKLENKSKEVINSQQMLIESQRSAIAAQSQLLNIYRLRVQRLKNLKTRKRILLDQSAQKLDNAKDGTVIKYSIPGTSQGGILKKQMKPHEKRRIE